MVYYDIVLCCVTHGYIVSCAVLHMIYYDIVSCAVLHMVTLCHVLCYTRVTLCHVLCYTRVTLCHVLCYTRLHCVMCCVTNGYIVSCVTLCHVLCVLVGEFTVKRLTVWLVIDLTTIQGRQLLQDALTYTVGVPKVK